MSDEGNLFTLLVQPVCAGFGTAPPATLLRMVDLARLLARPGLDWDQVVGLLSGAGLKTAAWMTLRHLELLSGSTPAAVIMASLAPGRMRRCLDRRLSGKPALCRQDNARPILPVHDRYGDALHAARRARQLERSREDDLQNLLSAIAVG